MLSPGSDLDPDRIFSPFDLTRRGAVVAAVSGGGDSLAMLLLLKRWLERNAPGLGLLAATVDHGLRAEARAEAEAVARFCGERDIPHRILTWTGDKPAAGVSAAARLARHELLAQAAAEAGADVVVTGHTADDQAETVAMRQARGGGRGLAGMAPATLFDRKVWVVRPLLGLRRERLRQFLREEGVAWIDDPTNLDPDYERVRVRRDLGGLAGGNEQVEALLLVAAQAGAERQALGARAARLIEAHAERPIAGLLRLAPDFARDEDEEAALLALRALLAVAGGVEQLPDAGRAAALLGRLGEGRVRATLSRTVVDARTSGVFLYRERRGVPEAPAVAGTIWDGRYEIVERGWREPPATAGVAPPVPPSIASAVRATMPHVGGSGLEAIPILAPWHRFLPSFDLALTRAVARLAGAAEILPPPFAGHNGKEA